MATQIITSGVQYSGIWNLSSQANAKGAATWPNANLFGSLYSWGSNGYGELGLGNVTQYSSPKQVGSQYSWSKVSTGYYASLAIKSQ